MTKHSAGVLVYKRTKKGVEVLLAHPGGPFWGKKDTWSIPKGETEENEGLQHAALREFKEEMGFEPPGTPETWLDLGQTKQGSAKINYIWAVEGDVDISQFVCASTFSMEWPPKSGVSQEFPENDRAAWMRIDIAKQKVYKAQAAFFDRLAEHLALTMPEPPEQTSLL